MSAAALPRLVDTHAHLQESAFNHDREAVLENARAAGVVAVVCVGYDVESSQKAVALAERHADVFAAVGIHPNDCGSATEADWAEICRLAREPRVVGIGETGLDDYRKRTPPELQERWLARHCDLAVERGLPVIIHNRDASLRLRKVLRTRDWPVSTRPPGVLHCFSADRETLEACLALGFVVSIAGPVTYKNAADLRALVPAVPADRLVVETDCPYLPPHPLRGTRNEPAHVRYTAAQLAEVRAESFPEFAERTTRTAAHLFGLQTTSPRGAEAH
jgi:TatD DNase family protein